MFRYISICVVLLTTLACSKSPGESNQRSRGYLEQAGSIYSAIGGIASKDGQSQVNALAYGQKAGDAALMRLVVALDLNFAAKHCTELRTMLLNFEAKEKLQEKITTEEYDKFIQAFDELSKSADNFVTNEKITEATPAAERLELHNAQSLVKQAYDLASVNRPVE